MVRRSGHPECCPLKISPGPHSPEAKTRPMHSYVVQILLQTWQLHSTFLRSNLNTITEQCTLDKFYCFSFPLFVWLSFLCVVELFIFFFFYLGFFPLSFCFLLFVFFSSFLNYLTWFYDVFMWMDIDPSLSGSFQHSFCFLLHFSVLCSQFLKLRWSSFAFHRLVSTILSSFFYLVPYSF